MEELKLSVGGVDSGKSAYETFLLEPIMFNFTQEWFIEGLIL